jgi:hypothetical protein
MNETMFIQVLFLFNELSH